MPSESQQLLIDAAKNLLEATGKSREEIDSISQNSVINFKYGETEYSLNIDQEFFLSGDEIIDNIDLIQALFASFDNAQEIKIISVLSQDNIIDSAMPRILKAEEKEKITRYLLLQAIEHKENLDVNQRVILRNRLIELVSNNHEGAQEDASEMFITPLLEIIYGNNHPIAINIATKKYDETPACEPRKESLNKIELAINANNISELFLNLQKPEYVDFKHSEGDGAIQTSEYFFEKDEIVFTLKRFGIEFGRDANNGVTATAIKINEPVELDNIKIKKSVESDETIEYEATAFVVHTGDIQGGHYIAFVKDAQGWWCYDDDKIIKVEGDNVSRFEELKKQAYIVKYRKTSLVELPAHQNFGTTNFDGLDNACWANASLALILSCDSIKTQLTAEFVGQENNFSEELAIVDKIIEEKAKLRFEKKQLQEQQQRLAMQQHELMQQYLLVQQQVAAQQALIYQERLQSAESLELISLQFSRINIRRLYLTKKESVLRLDDIKGEESVFQDFTNFVDNFQDQLNMESDAEHAKNRSTIKAANNSIIDVIFPNQNNPESKKIISKIKKTEAVQDKFFELFNSLISFYDLTIENDEETDESYLTIDEDGKSSGSTINSEAFDRLTKVMDSAEYFGYYGYATMIDDFLQTQPKEIKNGSQAKRARVNEEKQDSKITTDFLSSAILDFPDEAVPLKDQELTVGDLHGNFLKLLWILCYHDLIDIDQDNYNDLVSLYLEEQKDLQESDFQEFNDKISSIKLKNKNVFLRLIGDVFCDRGPNDYFTALLLGHLHNEGLESEIIFSNHDADFVESVNRYQGKEEKTSQVFKECLSSTIDGASISLENLRISLESGAIDENDFQNFYKIIEEKYLPQLKLISYNLKSDGSIAIFTHAPCGLKAIEMAAKKFGIEFKNASAKELATTIDAINLKFSEYAKGEVKREDGSVISLYDFDLGETATNKIDEVEMNLKWDEAYKLAARTDHQTVEELDSAIEKYPFVFLTWARIFKINHIFDENNLSYKVSFTFGHDNGGSIMPENLSAEEMARYEKCAENICNLDNEFAKGNNSCGEYTYRLDEKQKQKAKPNSAAGQPKADPTQILDEQIVIK